MHGDEQRKGSLILENFSSSSSQPTDHQGKKTPFSPPSERQQPIKMARLPIRLLFGIIAIFLFASPILAMFGQIINAARNDGPVLASNAYQAMKVLAANKNAGSPFAVVPVKKGYHGKYQSDETFREIMVKMADGGEVVVDWVKRHPRLTAAILAPVIVKGTLVAVGFHVAGVKAGSLAALIHSWIGNVGSGSVFAMLQSLGATSTFNALLAAEGKLGLIMLIDHLGQQAYENGFGEKEVSEMLNQFLNWAQGKEGA